MYEKRNKGWWKHLDFIILDILCLQVAFVLAYSVRFGLDNPYRNAEYLRMAVLYTMVDFCVSIIFNTFKNILKRSYYKEVTAVCQHVFLVEGIMLLLLFSMRNSTVYSRIFFYLMVPLYMGITFLGRIFWKKKLKKGQLFQSGKSLVIIAPRKRLEECIDNICRTNYNIYRSVGAVAVDGSFKGQIINGIQVVADYEDAVDYICREWVDEVFLDIDMADGYPVDLMEDLKRMGVVIHLAITKEGDIQENKHQVERLGNYTVLTTGLNYAKTSQLMAKRLMDIVGSLAGCLVTLVLILIFGPIIFFSSPGPIFFSQERVGKNGKRFRMYKFRTMYPDAEERKKELLAENCVSGGLMFKLDYDPRIIGSKKLPDGTIRKGIGNFLRESSLDEFPQMINVLKGDMSLVGTRPPTVDEWKQYELHHRARLAFRPGLTGLWQISGRSNITDFEEVVKLDTKYIDEWSIGQDIKILLKTVRVVVQGEGAK